jgi:tungstate transport system ATP-binding protein
MTPLIEVKELCVRRGNKSILEVSRLSIERGEVLALIGPNGAGKTTLLLALARLIKPAQGEIKFNIHVVARSEATKQSPVILADSGRQEIASLAKERLTRNDTDLAYRRRIGLVMQDPLLLDRSVFDNVAVGLKFRGVPGKEIQARVTDWLARLGIDHLRLRRAASLSGGEAQRVALARAFVLQPELLLLDEPFSALDAPTRARLLTDLKTLLVETHITTVFVTHDLNDALVLGQRLAVLMRGTIRQVDAPVAVFRNPADADVAEFVASQSPPGRPQ